MGLTLNLSGVGRTNPFRAACIWRFCARGSTVQTVVRLSSNSKNHCCWAVYRSGHESDNIEDVEYVVFSLGDFAVTSGLALVVAGAGIALALFALLIATIGNGRARIEAAAKAATDNLRNSFDQQLGDRDQRIGELEAELAQNRQDNSALQAEAAALRAKMEEQQIQAEQNLRRFQSARQQMTDEFKVIATDVLKSHGETFSRQNREQVDNLLKPLSDKIIEFQTGLLKDRAAMGESIRALVHSNQVIVTEANNLTRALKGSSQTQGAWGEMILSSILERSGLREGEQFFTQQSHTASDGSRVRTDVEILMPNGDKMIVDSKVSLTAFEVFTNAEDETTRAQGLRDHITSMRGHIKTLGRKEYPRHAKSGLDFVLMFVPIEAAFAAALTKDPALIDFGLEQGVLVTTPTTLMSALRTVRNVWDIENRHKNAEVIAERAGALYDKVAGFLGSMDRLEKSINSAQKNFDDAKGQLVSGRGSVVRQVEMLQELGAKNNKLIPQGWDGKTDKAAPKEERLLPAETKDTQDPEE